MGGNALKEFNTSRMNPQEFGCVSKDALNFICGTISENGSAGIIPSYRNKADFGDVDILYSSDCMPKDWTGQFKARYLNGPFTSVPFAIRGTRRYAQVDFIKVPHEDFNFAMGYFSFNDLGNLVGKISRKLGFKFGHDGLHLIRRAKNESEIISDICLTKDFNTAIDFLGFPPMPESFDEIEDVFRYICRHPAVALNAFDLTKLSHDQRIRDRKRKTYTRFLDYIEHREDIPDFVDYSQMKSTMREKMFEFFPGVGDIIKFDDEKFHIKKSVKAIFNGENISRLTGLSGKELGEFMQNVVLTLGPTRDEFRREIYFEYVMPGRLTEFEDFVKNF